MQQVVIPAIRPRKSGLDGLFVSRWDPNTREVIREQMDELLRRDTVCLHHCLRVATAAGAIARDLDMLDEEVSDVVAAALLHEMRMPPEIMRPWEKRSMDAAPPLFRPAEDRQAASRIDRLSTEVLAIIRAQNATLFGHVAMAQRNFGDVPLGGYVVGIADRMDRALYGYRERAVPVTAVMRSVLRVQDVTYPNRVVQSALVFLTRRFVRQEEPPPEPLPQTPESEDAVGWVVSGQEVVYGHG